MSAQTLVTDLEIAIVAAISVLILIGQLVSMAWPTVRNLLSERPPEKNVSAIAFFTLIPALSSLAIFCACMGVAASTGFDLVPEHCHPGASGTQCIPHTPVDRTSISLFVLFAVVVAALLATCLSGSLSILKYRSLCKTLSYCASYNPTIDAYIVHDDRPFALCSGLFRQQIFVSTRLMDELSQDELKIVLDHERCHASGAHGALLLLIRCFSITMRRPVRRELVEQFHLAAENACDQFAAKRCGSNLDVAIALIKIKRLCDSVLHPININNQSVLLSITGGVLERRVAWLVNRPLNVKNEVGGVIWHLLIYSVIASFVLAEVAHHSIESLIVRLVL